MNESEGGPAIVLLAAVADNGVIGRDNAIPWRLKSDQQRLKAMTWGKPIIMGRKTFVSLRRPLPGRTNIVITRDPNYRAAGAVSTTTFADALLTARGDALRRNAAEIAIIGGVEIYRLALPLADRLEITEVHDSPEGDARFPQVDGAQWQQVERSRHPASGDDSADFSYVTYRRKAA